MDITFAKELIEGMNEAYQEILTENKLDDTDINRAYFYKQVVNELSTDEELKDIDSEAVEFVIKYCLELHDQAQEGIRQLIRAVIKSG